LGIWIELGVFLLVFVFAFFQLRELKQERLKREKQTQSEKNNTDPES
jgi:hypothetical protein